MDDARRGMYRDEVRVLAVLIVACAACAACAGAPRPAPHRLANTPDGATHMTDGPTDRDGDGVPDLQDQCPTIPEDKDHVADDDGCPETDADGDGIPDEADHCPLAREDGHGDAHDGCPLEIDEE